MANIFAGSILPESLGWLAPWFLLAFVALYFVGYADGSIHGAAFGSVGVNLGFVHEFFHHARHVALMCH